MELFGMGAGEILLILILALIFWGPDKLPEIARALGKTMHAFRKAAFDLTSEITKEVDAERKVPLPPLQASGSAQSERQVAADKTDSQAKTTNIEQ